MTRTRPSRSSSTPSTSSRADRTIAKGGGGLPLGERQLRLGVEVEIKHPGRGRVALLSLSNGGDGRGGSRRSRGDPRQGPVGPPPPPHHPPPRAPLRAAEDRR